MSCLSSLVRALEEAFLVDERDQVPGPSTDEGIYLLLVSFALVVTFDFFMASIFLLDFSEMLPPVDPFVILFL